MTTTLTPTTSRLEQRDAARAPRPSTPYLELDVPAAVAKYEALAAALPSLEHACGLGTVALLACDVAVAPLVPVAGALAVGRVAVDPERLEQFAATPERIAWWRERVADCADHLREATR